MEDNIIEEMMKQEILIIGNKQKKIEELIEKEIISDDVFNFIFSTDNIYSREQFIIKLQERAKKLGLKPNFDKMLKQCEREEKKSKQQIEKAMAKELSHDEVAEKIANENRLAVLYDDIYIYDNGVYKNDTRMLGNKVIQEVKKATTRFRNEVYDYLKLIVPKKEIDIESDIINFKNGLLNIKTGDFIEHTPDFFSINQINANYNPNAEKIQDIDDVLDKLSNYKPKRKQTLLEMIGYCMTTSVKLQKAFILLGKSANNGKSTLLEIIDKLIGEENVAKVSFNDLTEDKFSASGIKGKILNTRAEMPNGYIKEVGKLKELITGDRLEIEEKYKNKQTILPYAKYIFNANELPRTADKTNGFYRRFEIIVLEYPFSAKDLKTFNPHNIKNKKALEYLAKLSIQAYMNKGDTFANHEESEREIDAYKKESNNVLLFLDDKDYIREFIEANVSTKKAIEVYEYYKRYCRENGDTPIGSQKFYKEMEENEYITKGKYQGWITFTFDRKHFFNN